MRKRMVFYLALCLVTGSTLVLQLIQVRILSVVTWYHMGFFIISMAMFGLTAGSIYVYMMKKKFMRSSFNANLSFYTMLFSLSLFTCTLLQMTLPLVLFKSLASLLLWLELSILIAIPFFFSGIVVSLALSQSPYPIGYVYAVDLVGAGIGAISTILLLNNIDAVSALLFLCFITMCASLLFKTDTKPVFKFCSVLFFLSCSMINNALDYGLQPIMSKGSLENGSSFDKVEWNSFSRITTSKIYLGKPMLWGRPEAFDDNRLPTLPQRSIVIDADAGTVMQRYTGSAKEIEYLKLDQVNLGYSLPDRKKIVVIGIGGGRDLLSARAFGAEDITGIEINPNIINFLDKYPETKKFANLRAIPNLKIIEDDGRSWMVRNKEKYDLIQMSLIDTWAATGAGSFSLSENSLYTVESWKLFIKNLSEDGIYTVSRWFRHTGFDETGRMLSLAITALYELDAEEPRKHIFMSATGPVATLILSRNPLPLKYVNSLEKTVQSNNYKILYSPIKSSLDVGRINNDVINRISKVKNRKELDKYLATLPYDLTPSSDDRPFFFNQLPFKNPLKILRLLKSWITDDSGAGGIRSGNFFATGVLLILLCISIIFSLAVILFPITATKSVNKMALISSTLYFSLIGVGFIFIEISLLQHMNIFLGRPIYSLSIVLFTLILSTGLGSFLSNKFCINNNTKLVLWVCCIIIFSSTLVLAWPTLFDYFVGESLIIRCFVCILILIPLGLLLGFGFPTGMSLISLSGNNALTPWLFGINGAGGVLGSVIAIILSIGYGINFTFMMGAICYLLLIPFGSYLLRKAYYTIKTIPI